MIFDKQAQHNPIDRMTVVGQPLDRIDGALKTTGMARYAYEQHDVTANQAYGVILGAAIAKGRIVAIDTRKASKALGVLAIVSATNAGLVQAGEFYKAMPLAGPLVQHYHQAVAVVVAETFEQARAASLLIDVQYLAEPGVYDLEQVHREGVRVKSDPDTDTGDFEQQFLQSPVQVDECYTTPDHSHAMMEPHATVAAWDGEQLTLWTSVQILAWARRDLARILGIDKNRIRLVSPYVGGGFGGKATTLSDAVMAALAAREAKRPVKVTLQRALMINNTTHRPATIQRVRLGADRDGRLLAIGHESWSGNIPGGPAERATLPTHSLYAAANRMTRLRQSVLDLPEGNAMRAPGEAPGMMAVEVAMDELAEKLGIDPVQLRLLNDTPDDPRTPGRAFSTRRFEECLRVGAERFGWSRRSASPAGAREGRWLTGLGMASAIRGDNVSPSGARVRLTPAGRVIVETDMTDIGTGSYTIIGQTAAEMLGIGLDQVEVRLGDTNFPESSGSLGQKGANSATSGTWAACFALRRLISQKLGFPEDDTVFSNGIVSAGGKQAPLRNAAADGELIGEDRITFDAFRDDLAHQSFGAHFCEVAVDAFTGEVRVRRMLAVCDAGRILNPKTARSQVIGAMTMGAGAALMEELAIDQRKGFFVNHDLASYEVPVHADIPHQEVIFLQGSDPHSSPMKAKGVGEVGITGVAAAIANAVYNATGIRVRSYPITLDKMIEHLPHGVSVFKPTSEGVNR